ncbi:MAG: hypothetical protein KatS3mg114_0259 [Planctomycetaceae bacterium]|nr:MAG: hypothetical protein KatS3mg114_0259 [Planctomycetaceae bacterium]
MHRAFMSWRHTVTRWISRGCCWVGMVFLFLLSEAVAQDVEARLQALEQAVQQAQAAQREAEAVHQQAQQKGQQLADAVAKLKSELNQAETGLAEAQTKDHQAYDAFVKAEQERRAAVEAWLAARKAWHEAAGKESEPAARQAYHQAAEVLGQKIQAAQAALQAWQTSREAVQAMWLVLAQKPAQIEAAERAYLAFLPELQAAEQAAQKRAQATLEQQMAWEAALVDAGRLVSFARQIAPILSERCLACHNARTAKGRLNLESYAQLQRGGESGPAIQPGLPAESNLYVQVETGAMPQDADPLTPEQLALIKKWIELGAKLDTGVSATAPLIAIMPKPRQPDPPETYRVPMAVMALAFSPDGEWLATSGYREVLLWKTADGSLVRRFTNLAERPHDIAFSPDGQELAVAAGTPGQLGEVKIYNVADGGLLADLFTTDDEAFCVAYSPDGSRLAAGSADRTLRLFDRASRKPLRVSEDHADWVLDVAWSPDGSKLATASRDKTAKVFDAASGEALVTFNAHQQPLYSVEFLPDGQHLVSGGRDNRLRVWTLAEAKQVREIGGFGGEVFRLLVLPDGHGVSTSADKQVRLHNLTNGQQVRVFSGHNEWVYCVSWHAATRRIATGSHDGEVRIWNLDDAKLLFQFTASPGHQPRVASAP